MASYSILGATGNCGLALLNLLLSTTDATIKVYCRNKAKLVGLLPEVATKYSQRVEIYNGSITDVDLLASAMSGCKAVFLTASTNDNVPGCHISQDLARTVISALERSKGQAKMPRLVLLSSSTIDPWLSRKHPVVNAIVGRSAWHVYKDLELAEAFLRTHEDWVSCVYIKPGGLSVDIQRGHKLTLDDDESFVSYLDIAAGMIESAEDPEGRWDNKNVGVVNTNGKASFPKGSPRCIFFGLLRYYFPSLHSYLPSGMGPT